MFVIRNIKDYFRFLEVMAMQTNILTDEQYKMLSKIWKQLNRLCEERYVLRNRGEI